MSIEVTVQNVDDMLEAAKPLIKYIAENYHPHVTVIVTNNSVELLEGVMQANTDEFLKD